MNYEVKTNFDYDADFSTQDYLSSDIVFAGENYLASSADVGNNFAQEILNSVNTERANVGLKSLSLSGTLMNGAAIRANELTTYYSHTRPDGTDCFTVVEDTYPSYYIGENIAAGQESTSEVMNGWMNSPGHRANILRPSYSELGVGLAYGSDRYYWVQLFGNPYLSPKDSSEGFSFIGSSNSQVTLKVGSNFNAEVWAESVSDSDYTIVAVNAEENSNNLILAGNSISNTIYDGSGNSSLWGGTGNVDDTLVGSSGAEMFWYGKYDGYDVITNADSSDVVNLYDVNLSEITAANVSANQVVIRFNTGTALVIKDSNSVTPTFQLGGGGRYNYNRASGQWQTSSQQLVAINQQLANYSLFTTN